MGDIDKTLQRLQTKSEANSERDQLIRLEILRILAQCKGYLLAEPLLWTHLHAALSGHIGRGEFRLNLDWLDNEKYVGHVKPELGGPAKWKITDQGRATIGDEE